MIAIIDYGVGNLFSLAHSLKAVGAQAVVTGDAKEISRAERVILPGVGAFGDAAEKLRQTGLDALVKQTAALFGGTAEIAWNDNTSPLINDPAATAEAQRVAVSLFGEDKLIRSRQPSLGGDDFAEYILRVPGAYAYIGTGNPALPDTLLAQHSARYDIDEDALRVAAALYVCYTVEYLNGLV